MEGWIVRLIVLGVRAAKGGRRRRGARRAIGLIHCEFRMRALSGSPFVLGSLFHDDSKWTVVVGVKVYWKFVDVFDSRLDLPEGEAPPSSVFITFGFLRGASVCWGRQ